MTAVHCSLVITRAESWQDMASCPDYDAQNKVWRSPELVNKLLPMLDTHAVWSLATAQPLIVKVLQNSLTWNQIISFYDEHTERVSYQARRSFEDSLELNRTEMGYLSGVLKKMEDPKPHLMELLDLICERFPPHDYFHVQVSCPRHISHSVSTLGFLLLEDTEGALGSTVQKIKTVILYEMEDPWLSALGARMSRQQEVIERIRAVTFVCTSQTGAEATLAMLQKCEELDMQALNVHGRVGRKSWSLLAQALGLHPAGYHAIYCTKGTILKARKEDLRKIWDGLGIAVHLHGCQGVGCNHPPSSNWVVRNVSRIFLGDGTEEEKEEEWDRLEKNLNKWIYFPWSEEEVEGEEEDRGAEDEQEKVE